MTDLSPYFKMYPRDFFANSKVARMTADEQGMYALLLFREWMDGSLPASHQDLAELVGLSLAVFERRWKRVSKCFKLSEEDDAKLLNSRLESERNEMLAKANANKDAASKRWEKQKIQKAPKKPITTRAKNANACERIANALQTQCHADADADASTPSSDTNVSTDGACAPLSAQAGTSKKPDLSFRPPMPPDLPTTWPEDVNGLKRLAMPFLSAFGNCTKPDSIKKNGPAYVDVLAILKNRRGITIADAWDAFSDLLESREGKPIFSAIAKNVLCHLAQPSLKVVPFAAYQGRNDRPMPQAPPMVTLESMAAML